MDTSLVIGIARANQTNNTSELTTLLGLHVTS